jgi:hypothetical protein
MSPVSITFDVEALAREANDAVDRALGFLPQDLHTGLTEERSVARGMKYPLLRLHGMGQVTEDEREDLGQLIVDASEGKDVTDLVKKIRGRENPSPLAITLAEITVDPRSHGGRADRLQVVVGAIAGGYLGHTLTRASIQAANVGVGSNARDDAEAVIGIVGAAGGALAATAIAIVQQFQASTG